MKYEMSLSKFLKTYFDIPNSKSKYIRHRDFKSMMPHLVCIPTSRDELTKNIISNNWICVRDCEGKISYYLNPGFECNYYTSNRFEDSKEFIESPIYYRFKKYEVENSNNNEVDLELKALYEKVRNIEFLEKWEILELRSLIYKYSKITQEKNYFILNLIKKELSKRRKIEIVKRKVYKNKKGEDFYD